MFRPVIRALILVLVLSVVLPGSGACFSWGSKSLVTINGRDYSAEDYRHWWQHWNDKGTLPMPESPDLFIDFHLLVEQGRAMELDKNPRFLHKIEVFRKVRSMMALKREEVDSQIKIGEAQLGKYFDQHYAPRRLLQVLTFVEADPARQAYERMLPFQGKKGGRLVFADLQGGSEEARAERYDELWLTPDDFFRNKKDAWLKIVEKIQVNEVSSPYFYEEHQKHLLFRLAEQQPGDPELLVQNEKNIREAIYKEERNRLTTVLIAKLMKKYEVEVLNDRLEQIDLAGPHDEDYLQLPLVVMKGATYTVGDLIYNANKELQTRRGAEAGFVKNLVVNNMISQHLIDTEALARGYENKPPEKWTFDFYQQHRLGAEVDAQLLEAVTVSDAELEAYYQANLNAYSEPEITRFNLIEGEEEALKKIWIGAVQGGQLAELAQKYALQAVAKTESRKDLGPELLVELDKLEKDGVSAPFRFGDRYVMVQFLSRSQGRVHALEEMKDKLADLVKRQKFEVAKAEYVEKLRSRSEIEINQSKWRDLVREYKNAINN